MASPARQSRNSSASAAEAVRGGLRRRLAAAIELLETGGDDAVAQVHGFRKHMKRARAVIRLLAEADGLDLKGIERDCRDVARRLSSLRDLDVTIASLAAHHPDGGGWPAALSTRLAAARVAELERGVLEPAALTAMADRLRQADAELGRLSVAHLSEDDLLTALGRSHRRGRKALHRVRETPSEEHFHELRKRAKRELYQREQLAEAMTLPHADRTAGLDALCDRLGERQDLAVLRAAARRYGLLTAPLDRWLSACGAALGRALLREGAALYD